MKLLRQTQRMFLSAALPIFIVAALALYLAMQLAIQHETDEKLADTRAALEDFAQLHDTLPAFFQRSDERLGWTPMHSAPSDVRSIFSDTTFFNPHENEEEPIRCLRFPLNIRGQWRQVSVWQSTVEQEELALLVITLLAVSLGLLLGVMLWVNRAVSRQVWQPFYATLEKIKNFRLNDQEPLHLPLAAVQEFQALNATLESLTERVQKDFNTVKKFTENASHELQTPLAIIQNKLELLLQDEALSESQARQLDIVGQNTRRMARLNQSLLLLSKIENNQFSGRNPLELKPLLEKKLAWLEDFIAEKQLTVQVDLKDKTLEINSFLAETLVTNLLANAVKHNLEGGMLRIGLDAQSLVIENTSSAPNQSVEDLSARFARGNQQTEGLGLGLSIVAEICAQQGFDLRLAFENEFWQVQIRFPP